MNKEIKELIVYNMLFIVLGVIFGFSLLLGWLFLRSYMFGWGDGAPLWYVTVQEYIHLGVICIAVLISVVTGNIFFFKR